MRSPRLSDESLRSSHTTAKGSSIKAPHIRRCLSYFGYSDFFILVSKRTYDIMLGAILCLVFGLSYGRCLEPEAWRPVIGSVLPRDRRIAAGQFMALELPGVGIRMSGGSGYAVTARVLPSAKIRFSNRPGSAVIKEEPS